MTGLKSRNPVKTEYGLPWLLMILRVHELESPTETKKKAERKARLFSWCSIVDAFQTAATLAQEDYKLKHLAEQFRLADNLI